MKRLIAAEFFFVLRRYLNEFKEGQIKITIQA